MKKTILFLCCMLAGYLTIAQKLKRLEYFIDTDPGTGKGKNIGIAQNDTTIVNTAIVIPALIPGPHILYLRAANENGWGNTENYPFLVIDTAGGGSIVKAEYYFDNDPGTGKGEKLKIVPGDTLRLNQTTASGPLSNGMHSIYVRVQNGNGQWTATENALFFVTPLSKNAAKLSAAEYFIDTDPGVGKAKSLKPPKSSDTLRGSVNIKVPAGLTAGVYHYLCIRFKDIDGNWGLYEIDSFYVSPTAFSKIQLHLEQHKGRQANLYWTVTQPGEGLYEIEKSSNGIDFSAIAQINAASGKSLYNLTDTKLRQYFSYYRVKYTDTNRNTDYSNIAQLYLPMSDARNINIFPNPVMDVVNIQFNGKGLKLLISLYDAGGRQVRNWQLNAANQIQLNINGLSPGNYLLYLTDGDAVYTSKLLKQ